MFFNRNNGRTTKTIKATIYNDLKLVKTSYSFRNRYACVLCPEWWQYCVWTLNLKFRKIKIWYCFQISTKAAMFSCKQRGQLKDRMSKKLFKVGIEKAIYIYALVLRNSHDYATFAFPYTLIHALSAILKFILVYREC